MALGDQNGLLLKRVSQLECFYSVECTIFVMVHGIMQFMYIQGSAYFRVDTIQTMSFSLACIK